MTSDFYIYRTANERTQQHGLKGVSDYADDRIATHTDLQDHDEVAVVERTIVFDETTAD